jgi:hypothetical protein
MKKIKSKCKEPVLWIDNGPEGQMEVGPSPWYVSQSPVEEQLAALSAYKPGPRARTYAECEAVLVAAGFTADQVQALKACGAIQV